MIDDDWGLGRVQCTSFSEVQTLWYSAAKGQKPESHPPNAEKHDWSTFNRQYRHADHVLAASSPVSSRWFTGGKGEWRQETA
jgi:hypothetical protein